MLERTAASIEPCSSSLQRVLPSATICLRTRRKLQISFWRHGAADLELADACQALRRHSPAESHVRGPKARPNTSTDATTPAATLLERLYPRGTAALLHRPCYVLPPRLEASQVARNHASRLFTSAVPRRSQQSPDPSVSAKPTTSVDATSEKNLKDGSEDGLGGPEQSAGDSAGAEGSADIVLFREEIQELQKAGAYDAVYQHYEKLDPSLKSHCIPDVVMTLSKSAGRPADASRMYELLNGYPPHLWTEELAVAVIEAQLEFDRTTEAMDIYETALQHHGFGRALDNIAAYAFQESNWDLVLDAWELYLQAKGDIASIPEPPVPTGQSAGTLLPESPDFLEEDEEDGQGAAPKLADAELEASTDATPAPPDMHVPDPSEVQDAIPTHAEEVEPSESPSVEVPQTQDVGSSLQTETVVPESGESVPEPTPALDSEAMPVSVSEQAVQTHGEPEADTTPSQTTRSGPTPNSQEELASSADDRISTEIADGQVTALGYPLLAATSELGAKLKELYEILESDPETKKETTALADSFLRHVVRNSMELFSVPVVVFMLHRSRDPESYARFIVTNIEQDRKRVARDLYRKYRVLPNVRVAGSVLRAMPKVLLPNDIMGMERLLEDWYRTFGRLNKRAYRTFIDFYAEQGNSRIVQRLAAEYTAYYGINLERDPKFITTLMRAHSVRGDPEATRQVMIEAAEKHGIQPGREQWNLVLDAHFRSGDYRTTIRLFNEICTELGPDAHTITTMMSMAGLRGDLQFALDLFQLARRHNVKPTMAMLRALAGAYCANDRATDAQKLCAAVTKKKDTPGDYATLWNAVIQWRSRRRDLVGVNNLLEAMSAHGVAFNQETYLSLLMALIRTYQVSHAMELLRVATQEGAVEPSPGFYLPLMKGFLMTGQPHNALLLDWQMNGMDFPASGRRMTTLIGTLGRWQQLPFNKRLGADGAYYLRLILRHFHDVIQAEEQASADKITSIISLFSNVTFFLINMRQFATVDQIIRMFQERFPEYATPETMPLRILHQSLLADFEQKNFGRAKETWDIILRRSSWRYQPAATFFSEKHGEEEEENAGIDTYSIPPRPVLYAQRFRLSDPLKTMQRLYLEEGNADALIELVDTVRRLGFDLTNKNWNYHVQALARLKRYREAFTVCELVLMSQWTGWHQVRFRQMPHSKAPLELRRIGRNPARPRPVSFTLLQLAKEYLDLEEAMLWSHEAGREFELIEEKCVKTVHAIKTMLQTGSELELEIFGERGRPSLQKPYPGFEKEQQLREEEQKGEVEPGEEAPWGDTAEDDAYDNVPLEEWSDELERKGPRALEELWDEFLEKREQRLHKVQTTWRGGRMIRPWQETVFAQRRRKWRRGKKWMVQFAEDHHPDEELEEEEYEDYDIGWEGVTEGDVPEEERRGGDMVADGDITNLEDQPSPPQAQFSDQYFTEDGFFQTVDESTAPPPQPSPPESQRQVLLKYFIGKDPSQTMDKKSAPTPKPDEDTVSKPKEPEELFTENGFLQTVDEESIPSPKPDKDSLSRPKEADELFTEDPFLQIVDEQPAPSPKPEKDSLSKSKASEEPLMDQPSPPQPRRQFSDEYLTEDGFFQTVVEKFAPSPKPEKEEKRKKAKEASPALVKLLHSVREKEAIIGGQGGSQADRRTPDLRWLKFETEGPDPVPTGDKKAQDQAEVDRRREEFLQWMRARVEELEAEAAKKKAEEQRQANRRRQGRKPKPSPDDAFFPEDASVNAADDAKKTAKGKTMTPAKKKATLSQEEFMDALISEETEQTKNQSNETQGENVKSFAGDDAKSSGNEPLTEEEIQKKKEEEKRQLRWERKMAKKAEKREKNREKREEMLAKMRARKERRERENRARNEQEMKEERAQRKKETAAWEILKAADDANPAVAENTGKNRQDQVQERQAQAAARHPGDLAYWLKPTGEEPGQGEKEKKKEEEEEEEEDRKVRKKREGKLRNDTSFDEGGFLKAADDAKPDARNTDELDREKMIRMLQGLYKEEKKRMKERNEKKGRKKWKKKK
ncbi:hypothetical protein VTJ49DRAFT_5867 [Mycothermus thermophilus]|uniref:Uncharacterized protein n=1 Tax=Humicola insolens TaxID=85995 RepID=A0ABR3VK75_HUMIN